MTSEIVIGDDQRIHEQADGATRSVAVIDIGASSIRMAIAQIDEAGKIQTLENLEQSVNLGRDTFTKRRIERETIEECVSALKSFARILQEYHITESDQIRAVATSAVREAQNRQAFLDRVYIGTGIQVEPIDESEVARLTYLSVQPYLNVDPLLSKEDTLIIEVGGGNTELLFLRQGDIAFSNTYRLGSLRMREMLEAYRAPASRMRNVMENHVQRTVDQVVQATGEDIRPNMIALGGDARFAVGQILDTWDPDRLARLPVKSLERFTHRILEMSVDELVRKYHMTFTDAESLGPTLLSYVLFARAFKLQHVLVTDKTLRDGLLMELAAKGAWTDEFREQIVKSAIDLGRKFHFDERHGKQVAALCKRLYVALEDVHELAPRYRLLLKLAAILHEVGLFIGVQGHHKHSMYIILNSELFGLGRKDMLLVALVARYHRRASPSPAHQGYAALDRDDRVAVSKMAAILRVADALDRAHNRRINKMECSALEGELVITVPGVDDITIEQLALKEKGSLFEEVFGMNVVFRADGGSKTGA